MHALASDVPIEIDESDADIGVFPRARALGYRGISAKSCKGVSRALINRARVAQWNAEEGGERYFMSAEDLTTQAGVAVQQDLALATLIGATHVERNGHHYVDGMAGAPSAEQDAFLTAHPDLYRRGADGRARLSIRDGAVALGSLAATRGPRGRRNAGLWRHAGECMNTDNLSINLATVRQQWTLREAVEGCARHGITAIDPWRDQVAATGLDEAARIIRDHGMRVTGYCRGGMFPAPDAAGRGAAIEDNMRAVDEAAAIGAECLVLVCGGLPQGSRDIAGARAMVLDGLAAVLPHARARNMPLAIEPLHPMYAADRACVNTLARRSTCATCWATASASRSTPITCGGTPTWRRRSPARATASWRTTSATGWCRRATCCSTAA